MRYLSFSEREKIGLEYILSNLSTISPYGEIKKRNITPISSVNLLEKKFDDLEMFREKLKR